jgi:hypothetical protein
MTLPYFGIDFAREFGSVLFTERKPASTFSNAPSQKPWLSPYKATLTPTVDMTAPFLTAATFGYAIFVDRNLGPGRLERERGSGCINLSAQARNAKRLLETSRVIVDEPNRRIYCAPHVKALLEKAIAEAHR